jgi:Flp pilus assembly protein TadG
VIESNSPRSESGQVLVIAAVAFFALLGLAALAIDVSFLYSTQRFEQAVGDAASLAGAQQLQQAGTRGLGTTEYQNARTTAMQNLVDQLSSPGGSLPVCTTGGAAPYAADVTGCALPGTPYRVSIKAPSGYCLSSGCDPQRSVLVSMTRQLPTFFANLFGQHGWQVSRASVAGLQFGGKYAVVTLRPPKPAKNLDQNQEDIKIQSNNLVLQVLKGDIGSNTNLVVGGSGASVLLDPNFSVYYYDTYKAWTSPPPGIHITNLIQDPGYRIPLETDGAPPLPYTQASLSDARDTAIVGGVSSCSLQQAKVPAQYKVKGVPIRSMAASDVTCYKPGIYTRQLSDNTNTHAILLEPGVYFFDGGVKLGLGAFVGGYDPGQPGVAVVFNECNSSNCVFNGNNTELIALNAGSKYLNAGGQEATAAIGFDGNPVQTNTGRKPHEVLMSLIVRKDPACVVAPVDPPGCNETADNSLNVAGGGNLYLAGVQYAPTDNVSISGGATGTGYVGEIIAWTLKYTGGTVITQEFASNVPLGVLRLDQACSGTDVRNPVCYP